MTNASPLPFGTASSPRFLLLNAIAADKSLWKALHARYIVSTRMPDTVFPTLVDNEKLDDAQRQQLHDIMKTFEKKISECFVLAALDSPASEEEIAEHIVRTMNIKTPEGEPDLLRFYDPLVFRNLQGWLFHSGQMEALLGPIKTWHWRDPDGTWKKYTSSTYTNTNERTLQIREDQWPSLQRMSTLQRVLDSSGVWVIPENTSA